MIDNMQPIDLPGYELVVRVLTQFLLKYSTMHFSKIWDKTITSLVEKYHTL
jgi:hypothetical protein